MPFSNMNKINDVNIWRIGDIQVLPIQRAPSGFELTNLQQEGRLPNHCAISQ